jgi:hypothetical protein
VGQRLSDRAERVNIVCAKSIVIEGQDLVYDGTARHTRLRRIKDDFDGAAAGDSSCYTLRTQDGTLRHISSDWKMYYNQILHVVAQARQDPNFTTTLIAASFGGAVIQGFIHRSLADYVIDSVNAGQIVLILCLIACGPLWMTRN